MKLTDQQILDAGFDSWYLNAVKGSFQQEDAFVAGARWAATYLQPQNAPKTNTGCRACFGSGGKKHAPCKVCKGSGFVQKEDKSNG